MENQFPGNSNTQQPPAAAPAKKKVQKVVTGQVVQRKKPVGRRIKEFFFHGEDTKSVLSHVFHEVLVPAAKDAAYNAGDQALQRKLYGEFRARRGPVVPGGVFGNVTYNAYNRFAGGGVPSTLRPDPRAQVQQQMPLNRGRAQRRDIGELIFGSRAEATEVLDQMIAIIAQFQVVSLSDLWDMIGHTGEFTDEKWGWSDLMGADIQRSGDGYILLLPPLQPLAS